MREVLDGVWEQAQRAAVDPAEHFNARARTKSSCPSSCDPLPRGRPGASSVRRLARVQRLRPATQRQRFGPAIAFRAFRRSRDSPRGPRARARAVAGFGRLDSPRHATSRRPQTARLSDFWPTAARQPCTCVSGLSRDGAVVEAAKLRREGLVGLSRLSCRASGSEGTPPA